MSALACSPDEESNRFLQTEKTVNGFFNFTARPPWIKNVFLPDTPIRFYEFSSQENLIDINIKVNRVTSPVKFYWSLEKNRPALKQLTGKMGDLYHKKFGEFYSLEDDQTYVGQMVAVKYNDRQWHRARIMKIYAPLPYIDVIYVDYGTERRVHINKARHLHVDFTALPIQAMRGYLIGVEPALAYTLDAEQFLLGKFLRSLVVGREKIITATIRQVEAIVEREKRESPFWTKEYGMLLVDRSRSKEGIDVIQRCLSSETVRPSHSSIPAVP